MTRKQGADIRIISMDKKQGSDDFVATMSDATTFDVNMSAIVNVFGSGSTIIDVANATLYTVFGVDGEWQVDKSVVGSPIQHTGVMIGSKPNTLMGVEGLVYT